MMTEQMRHCNVSYIGEIPNGWDAKRIKYVIDDIKDGTHGTYDRVDSGEYLLSAKNVFDEGIVIGENESEISYKDYKSIISNGFPKKNDVLLCCVGTVGRCCVYTYDKAMAFQRSVSFLRPSQNTDSRFLKYALQSDSTIVQEQLLINKSAQDGLYMGSVKELIISLPKRLEEQKLIADFLDKRCAEIDSIIADIEKQIEILQKYKKSLIAETVTKGLNADAEFEHSELGWADRIPKSWDVKKIAYMSNSRSGGTPDRNNLDYWENGDIPWMSSGEVNKVNVYETEEKITMLATRNSSAKIISANSVLIALNGQGKTKGMSAILRIESTCNQSLCAFTCYEGVLHYEYLFWCFQAMYSYLRNMAGDGVRDGLAASYVQKQKIPVPAYSEQIEIANYLNKKCEQVDTIVSEKQSQLEVIKQHKKSLIYEYVTGKKRVKEAL